MKVVIQDGEKNCGVACLLSIIRHYGGDISQEILREYTNTSKDGVSALSLINCAKSIGFDAVGVHGEIDDIDRSKLPVIAHIMINKNIKHFIVIYEMNDSKDKIIIMDPSIGKKVISFSELSLLSTRNFIYLTPNKKIPVYKYRKIVKETIIDFVLINKMLIFILSVLTIIYFILGILISFHFKYLVDFSINYDISSNLYIISYFILALYILKNINSIEINIISLKLINKLDFILNNKIFKQLLLLPFSYYKNRSTGEIINRLKDLNVIREYITNILIFLFSDVVSIVVFIVFMFNIVKKITLLVIIYSILIIFINLFKKNILKNKLLKVKNKEDIVNSKLIEGINNFVTIKNNHIEKRLIDEYKINYNKLINSNYKFIKNNYIFSFIDDLFNNILIVFIYLFGSYYVIIDRISIIELFIYINFFNYYLSSFNRIITIINNYSSYNISRRRIDDLFNINYESFRDSYYFLPYDLKGNIKISNLNYKIGNRILFNNLNLNIKYGEKILVTGKSGSGKSTLFRILMRYILIDYGVVSINNIDINHYHLESIRSNITYVNNNEYLFNDTLINNICMYKDYDLEEINKLKDICLINCDLDKMIEENGFNFSSGEKQRVVLARALFRNSNIYIFDEALNQIDIYREKKILTNIFKYYKDKTIIIISHRNNNKNLFDRCLVLDEGRIYEK